MVRWFVIAAMIGFPFAMLFSWFYEWTPQGLVRESEVAPDESVTRETGKTMDRWIIAVLGIAVVLLLANTFVPHRNESATTFCGHPAHRRRIQRIVPVTIAVRRRRHPMSARSGMALLLVGAASLFAGPTESARAMDPIADATCEAAKDSAIDATIKAILRARGVPEWAISSGDGTYQATKDYLSHPDGERLDKAAQSATKSALSALVPSAGIAISGAELSVKGVEATLGEAEALRAKAFLCGSFSYGALRAPNFFSYERVRQIAPGVTCENFAERVTTYRQLTQLKEFWEGFYSQQVKQVNFDDLQTRDMLGQAWFSLQQQWAARWAETENRKIREEMLRSLAGPAQQRCAPSTDIQPASYMDPRTKDGHYVDRCFAYASGCDDNNNPDYKPSADAFCKSKGHSGVVPGGSKWSFKAPTQIQADGQLCTDPKGCGGLDYVNCR